MKPKPVYLTLKGRDALYAGEARTTLEAATLATRSASRTIDRRHVSEGPQGFYIRLERDP